MFVGGGVGAGEQVGRYGAASKPIALPSAGRLRGREVGYGERGDIPRAAVNEHPDALGVHNVAVFYRVRAQPNRRFYRVRVGGVRHNLEIALAAYVKRRLKFVFQQE